MIAVLITRGLPWQLGLHPLIDLSTWHQREAIPWIGSGPTQKMKMCLWLLNCHDILSWDMFSMLDHICTRIFYSLIWYHFHLVRIARSYSNHFMLWSCMSNNLDTGVWFYPSTSWLLLIHLPLLQTVNFQWPLITLSLMHCIFPQNHL